MKEAATTRPYRQRRRAEAAEARTEAILDATIALFEAKPFDQITLAEVAERAGVGLQTLIRRVQTKDGLVRALNEWAVAPIGEARGEPDSSDPAAVAAAVARRYERYGTLIDRNIRQEELSPALAESARGGREAHRAWIEAAFADEIARGGHRGPARRAGAGRRDPRRCPWRGTVAGRAKCADRALRAARARARARRGGRLPQWD